MLRRCICVLLQIDSTGWGEAEWHKISRYVYGKHDPDESGPQTWPKVHKTMALTTHPRQFRSCSEMTLQMFLSGLARERPLWRDLKLDVHQ